jgi:hypothetical protein
MEGGSVVQCKATSQRSGQRCQKHAIKGATVCLSHGAAARQVKRKAAEEVALAQVRAMFGVDEDDDPAGPSSPPSRPAMPSWSGLALP